MPPPEPERVASGEFHIDRARALELLSRFSLREAAAYVLPWARAAVALGARRIRLRERADGIRIEFDGRPLTEAATARLLDGLLADDAQPGLRELARGTLSALGRGATVRLGFGEGTARQVRVFTRDADSLAPGDPADELTWVESAFPGERAPGAEEALLRARAAACPAELDGSDGEPMRRLDGERGWWKLERCGLRVWVEQGLPGQPSRLAVHVLGIQAGTELEWLAAPQVYGHLASDDLKLDLSQESVVRDERWARVLADVSEAAGELAVERCRQLSLVMPRTGELLQDPLLYKAWRAAFKTPPSETALLWAQQHLALDAGRGLASKAEVSGLAGVVAWLRDAARLAFSGSERPTPGWRKALWSAPIYLTADGLPVSLAELESLRLRWGRVPIAPRPNSGEPHDQPALEVSSRGDLLARLAGPLGDRLGTL